MLHISCNIGTRDLPDMYALGPAALGLRAYISGKSLVPMLQLLHVGHSMYCQHYICIKISVGDEISLCCILQEYNDVGIDTNK